MTWLLTLVCWLSGGHEDHEVVETLGGRRQTKCVTCGRWATEKGWA